MIPDRGLSLHYSSLGLKPAEIETELEQLHGLIQLYYLRDKRRKKRLCMTEISFVKLFRYNQLCIRKINSASRPPPPSSSRNRNRERACGGGVRRAMCHDIVMPESSVHKRLKYRVAQVDVENLPLR